MDTARNLEGAARVLFALFAIGVRNDFGIEAEFLYFLERGI
jgi:hypothetical protein